MNNKGQAIMYALVGLIVLGGMLALGSSMDTLTGATGLGTQLVLTTGTMNTTTLIENTPFVIRISDFFDDFEGDILFYDNTPLNNITVTYNYTIPSSARSVGEFTTFLCSFDDTTNCLDSSQLNVTADFDGDVTFHPGRFNNGVLVENGTNLLPNPSFETFTGTIDNGINDSVPFWNTTNITGSFNTTSLLFIGNKSIEGNVSVELKKQVNDSIEAAGLMSNDITSITVGNDYTLSASVASGSSGLPSGFRMGLLFFDSSGGLLQSTFTTTTLSVNFNRISVTDKAPALATVVRAFFSVDSPVSFSAENASIIVDAVQIEVGKAATFYADAGPDTLNYTLSDTTFNKENGSIDFFFIPQFNVTNLISNKTILDIGNETVKGIHRLVIDISDNLNYIVIDSTGNNITALSTNISDFNKGEIHHITFTYTATGQKLYVDGVLKGESNVPLSLAQPTRMQFGSSLGFANGNNTNAIYDDFRILNQPIPPGEPVEVTLTPFGPEFDTDGTGGLDVRFNATDFTDEEFNWQNPIKIFVNSVANAPGQFTCPDGSIVNLNEDCPGDAVFNDSTPICVQEPIGCNPNAFPLSPNRCFCINGTILNRDILEESNYSANVSVLYRDPEGEPLTFSIIPGIGSADFTVIINGDNITWVPAAQFHDTGFFRIVATDPGGLTSTSNEFILNVLPQPDNLTKIANITNITMDENQATTILLDDFFFDPDNETLFGFNSIDPSNEFTLSMQFVFPGQVTVTPALGFVGNGTVNITANDLDAGIFFSEIVDLIVIQNDTCGLNVFRNRTMISNLNNCSGNGININVNDLVLDCNGTSISGDGTGIGINVTGRSGVTVQNCTISGFETGISVSSSQNITLLDVNITNTTTGILLEGSDNVIISSSSPNMITNADTGISFISSSDNVLNKTEIRDVQQGITLLLNSDNNVLENTTVRNASGNGITLSNSDFNTIRDMVVDRASNALLLTNSDNNTIAESGSLSSPKSHYDNSTIGIRFFSSSGNTIQDFVEINGNDIGLDLESSNDNTIGNITSSGSANNLTLNMDGSNDNLITDGNGILRAVINNSINTTFSAGDWETKTFVMESSSINFSGEVRCELAEPPCFKFIDSLDVTFSQGILISGTESSVEIIELGKGSINLSFPAADYNNTFTVNRDVIITSNTVFLNSSVTNWSQRNGTVTFFNVDEVDPIPAFDDDDSTPLNLIKCPTDRCLNISFNSTTNIFSYFVTNFSTTYSFIDIGCGIVVNESITLIRDQNATGDCYNIIANDVVIDCAGFTLRGNNTGEGVRASSVNNVSVRNCVLQNFSVGVVFTSVVNGTVVNNSIGNSSSSAISLLSLSDLITVANNTLGQNGRGLTITNSDNNMILSNNITFSSNEGILATLSDNNTFRFNNFLNNTEEGIELSISERNTIDNNTFDGNNRGVLLVSMADNNTISFNTIRDNEEGIRANSGSSLGVIFNNTFINNTLGVNFLAGSAHTLENNSISGSDVGIRVHFSGSSFIIGNNSLINNSIGTQIFNSSFGNIGYNNTVLAFNGTELQNIRFSAGFISLNTTNATKFIRSVVINLTGLGFNTTPAIFFDTGFFANSSAIIATENVCSASSTPSCTDINYVLASGVLTFNVSLLNGSFAAGNNLPTIFVITPNGVQNDTVNISFVVSDNENDTISVIAEFSIDGGDTYSPATGNPLADISTIKQAEILEITDDALIDSNLPNTNFGNSNTLEAGTDGGRLVRSLIKIPTITTDASIIGTVNLKLFQRTAAGEPRTIGLFRISESFNESDVTFNNAPGNLSLIDSVFVDSTLTFFTFNITEYFLNVTRGEIPNLGLMLKDVNEPSGTGLHLFASSEFGNTTPVMEINFDGVQNVFNWDSRADMNANNSDTVIIRLTINGTTVDDNTRNFTVHNNHPPEVNQSANRTFTIDENSELVLNMSNFFFDIDDQTLIFTVDDILNFTVDLQSDVNSSIFNVSNAPGFQGEPDIAIGLNDLRVVTWSDRRSGNSDIFFATFNSNNLKLVEVQVTDESAEQSEPAIAIDGSNTYIVWKDKRFGNFDIFLSKFSAGNNLLFEVNVTTQGAAQSLPDMIIENEIIFVVWEDLRNGNKDIFFARFALNGTKIGSDTIVVNTSLAEASLPDAAPVIVSNGTDKFVAWVNNFSLIQAAIINRNNTVGPVFNVSNRSIFAENPDIAIDGRGLVYYTWSDAKNVNNASNVFLAEFNGTVNQGEFLVVNDSNRRFDPEIVIDKDNNKFIVYQNEVNAQSDIKLARVNITNGFVKELAVATNNATQSLPSIAIDSTNTKIVVWQDGDGDDDIKLRSFSGKTGLITFTPDPEFFGNRTFNITADDGFNQTSANFTINVTIINDAPTLSTSIGPLNFSEDTNLSINLNTFFTDPDSNITFAVNSSPVNVTVVLNASTGNVTFVPDANFTGLDFVIFSASDENNTILSNNVTLNVTSVNDVPVITSLVINSTSGENRPSDNLTATVSVQDADDTILKNVFDWRISGTSIAVLNMPFESNTSNSTFTKDFSTFGNDGSVINATFSTTGGFDGFGAYQFDGDTDFILVNVTGDTIEMRIDNGTGFKHVVNASGTIYVNGIVSSASIPFNDTHIGIFPDGAFFNGTIDEVRIYNRTLSAEQILALFNNRTEIIVSNETNERENWAVTATPLDGEVEGQSVTSNTITIAVPSTINLSFIEGVFFSGIFFNAPGIFNGTLFGDTLTLGSEVNDSTVANSTLINSSIIMDSLVNFSTITNSSLSECTVINSTVINKMLTMCTIVNSFVDPPETGFINDSNITGSTIMSSNITSSNVSISNVTTSIVDSSEIISCDVVNSSVFNSTLLNCVLTNVTSVNSTVDNATLIDVNITDANITDGLLVNGTLIFNDTVFTGPRNLTDIMNFPPTASFTVDNANILTGDTVSFLGTASDPNIPGDLNDNLTFNWTFGDGTFNDNNVTTTNHTYTTAGTFSASFIVTDRFGKSTSATRTISVSQLAVAGTGGSGATGGGGGGPAGPRISIGGGGIACLENWVCNTWDACTEEGTQTRECVDLDECGTILLKPSEQRTCTFVPPATCDDGIQNQGEEDIDCGEPCAPCEVPAPLPAPPEPKVEEPKITMSAVASGIWLILILGIILMGVGGFVVYRKMQEDIGITYSGSNEDRLIQAIKLHLERGYGEKKIMEELIAVGWDPEAVKKGFDAYHFTLLEKPIMQGLAAGNTVHDLKKGFIEAGWKENVVDKVLMRATGREKIGPDPLEKIGSELDKLGDKIGEEKTRKEK